MYDLIISGMTWSYSRLKVYEQCPYKFFLQYIKPHDKAPKFFSDYGSFVHEILECFFRGDISREEAIRKYITQFGREVRCEAPSDKIFSNYFTQGLDYLRSVDMPSGQILGVEQEVRFSVEKWPFIGYIDLIIRDDEGGIVVWDNKSRTLKPRSKRAKSTKADEELDEYLRQLYLYSIPLLDLYGQQPSSLVFNCYRSQQIIREPFVNEKFDEANLWAIGLIDTIRRTEKWNPSLDYYFCKNLCDVARHCEYCEMTFGA